MAEKDSAIRLSIVFLNYNRLEETRRTVERLLAMTRDRNDIELIAVDNNSDDGTAGYLRRAEGVQAILLAENGGIAGYNEGFARAVGDYILVLDDDSCPRDEQTLSLLITLLDNHPGIGVLACHVETPAGEPQWQWHLPGAHRFGPSPFFIGCGFAVRRELFEKIGWYPGEFFLYQNEIDVAFKVRLEGYEIWYHPECRVIHRGVPGERPGWRCVYYPTRNTIWLIRRYYPQPQALYMLVSRLLIGLGRGIWLGQVRAWLRACGEGFGRSLERRKLPREIRRQSTPFFRQNSLLHQVLRIT